MVPNHVLQELSAKVNSSEREKLLGPVPSLERCEIALMQPGIIGLNKVKRALPHSFEEASLNGEIWRRKV